MKNAADMENNFTERLIVLAKHLETTLLLSRKKHCDTIQNKTTTIVRSFRIALEPMPLLFPLHFSLVDGEVIIRVEGCKCLITDLLKFFNIEGREFHHCFVPGMQQPLIYGGVRITSQTQHHQMAQNIHELIRRKQNGHLSVLKATILN